MKEIIKSKDFIFIFSTISFFFFQKLQMIAFAKTMTTQIFNRGKKIGTPSPTRYDILLLRTATAIFCPFLCGLSLLLLSHFVYFSSATHAQWNVTRQRRFKGQTQKLLSRRSRKKKKAIEWLSVGLYIWFFIKGTVKKKRSLISFRK